MYIVYTQDKFNEKYVLFASNSLDKLKQDYLDFYETNKDDYDLNEVLVEKELDSFSLNRPSSNFYYSNIEEVDANEKIYIFIFKQEEEVGYNNHIFFVFSNSKEKLLETAIDYFEGESAKTEQKDIDKMLNSLKKKGSYDIPYGRGYVCNMKIIEFEPFLQKI